MLSEIQTLDRANGASLTARLTPSPLWFARPLFWTAYGIIVHFKI
jgi:hypothetical protein